MFPGEGEQQGAGPVSAMLKVPLGSLCRILVRHLNTFVKANVSSKPNSNLPVCGVSFLRSKGASCLELMGTGEIYLIRELMGSWSGSCFLRLLNSPLRNGVYPAKLEDSCKLKPLRKF